MACCVAGITSDANVLTNELRAIAQRHTLQFGEPIPCEQLVMRLCDIKQAYTQTGGAFVFVLAFSTLPDTYYLHEVRKQTCPQYSKPCRAVMNIPPQASVHLVFPSCTWAGTTGMATSCTRVIPQATTQAGRPPALATVVRWVGLVQKFGTLYCSVIKSHIVVHCTFRYWFLYGTLAALALSNPMSYIYFI